MLNSRNVLAPDPQSEFNVLDFATPTEREAISKIATTPGAYVPSSTQERLEVATGEAGSFLDPLSKGLGEGFLGGAAKLLFDDDTPIAERARNDEILASYAKENTISSFFGEALGRAISDSPIDFTVSLGTTQVGKMIVKFMSMGSASARATKKVAEAVLAAKKGDATLSQRVFTDAVEGLISGVASESFQQQAFGKESSPEDIFEAGLLDMVGSPIFSEGLRGLGKLAGYSKNNLISSVAEEAASSTGVSKEYAKKVIALLPEIAEAGRGAKDLSPRTGKEPELELTDDIGARFSREVLQEQSPSFLRTAVEKETARQDKLKSEQLESQGRWADEVERRRLERGLDKARTRTRKKTDSFLEDTNDYIEDLEAASKDILSDLELGVKQAEGNIADEKAAKDALRAAQIQAAKLEVKTKKLRSSLDKLGTERKLLGTGDDLAKLSKESGIPVRELEELRKIQFDRMRELQAAKERGTLDVDDLKTRTDILDERIIEGKVKADGPSVKEVEGMPSVRNLEEFNTMGRFFGISKDYMALASELISRRAAASKMSVEKWLSIHNIQYKSSGGPHVVFDDAATILNAPAKATSVGDFFHELGHIFEADLDVKTRKVLADQYGMNGWSRDFSEKFSNDFLIYLRDARGTGSSKFPKSLKEAFNKVAKWLSDVFYDLTGNNKINNEVRDVFDRLFLETGNRASVKRRAKFAENLGEDRIRYRTPVEIKDDVIGDSAEKVKKRIEGAAKTLDSGNAPLAGKGIVARMLRSKKIPKFLGAGILTAENLFRGLGKEFSETFDDLLKGIEVESAIVNRRRNAMREIKDAVGLSDKDLDSLSKKKVTVKGKEIPANEAILLHMYAKDGLKSDGTSAQHSARAALVSDGYRISGESSPTKFTKAEVDEMSSNTWLEVTVGEEAIRASEVMGQSLKQFGTEFNSFYKSRTGQDAYDTEVGYFMKRTSASKRFKDGKIKGLENFEEAMQSAFSKMKENGRLGDKRTIFQTIADTTAVNHMREGTGILEYQDPFAATMTYVNQLSRLEALGDALTEAQIMHKFLAADIIESAGRNVHEAMGDILEKASGQSAFQDPISGKYFNTMYKGQVLSALTWNVSPILKQTPSMMAALMRLPNITQGPSGYINYLKKGVANKIEVDGKEVDLHEFLLENSPTYAVRYETAGQSPDISDANISDTFRSTLFGDIKISEAMEAQGLAGAGKAFVEKGMGGIRAADAATIRGIYLAVKDSLGEGATPEAIEALLSRTINETQPTYHPLTRTSVQSSRNMLHRQFGMFSSQPVKNFNLLLRDLIAKEQGGLSADELDVINKRIKTTYKMLAYQASAVAALGTVAVSGKDWALDQIRDEKDVKQRDKFLESQGLEWSKQWSQVFSSTFGNLPYSGPLLGELLKRVTIGDGFDVEVVPVNYINDTYKWAESVKGEGVLSKESFNLLLEYSKILGVPGVGIQATKAAASNFDS